MKEVYSTPYLVEADIVKSILESSGIKCFLRDENIASSYPAVTFYTQVRIVVDDEDYEPATKIIKEYLQKKKE